MYQLDIYPIRDLEVVCVMSQVLHIDPVESKPCPMRSLDIQHSCYLLDR